MPHAGAGAAFGEPAWPRLATDVVIVYACGMTEPPTGTSDPALRTALARVLHRRAVVQGSITLPAVPGMLDEYLALCLDTFGAVGVHFDDAQRDRLREALQTELSTAFTASPRSTIVITYDSPVGHMVTYHVAARWTSLEQAYDSWVSTRQPPYFGAEPDARVMHLALESGDPATCPVLDVGAGTGRNSLALARRGHPVDALELSGEFARRLREEAQASSLPVTVIQGDALAPRGDLRRAYGLMVVSEVVTDLRSTDELRSVFALAADCLGADGRLVMNAFVCRDGYEPDAAARQLGQQTYSAIFTRPEVLEAAATSGLELVDDTSVLDYERRHLPAESWPPTPWYEDWVSGRDVFAVERGTAPIELRWLVFRRHR